MSRQRDELGVGLVALPWAVLAYLVFLMLAVQVAVYFYSTSVVTAIGYDAAHRAAHRGGGVSARADAERWLRSRIGPAVEIMSLRWTATAETIALELTARPPSVLINTSAVIGRRDVERRFEIRRESARFGGVW
ncbi:hypothetical protein [Candidatus Poriferisodalis sp.]|uniref:hypothetical protein n=1 Tax=Candidatus Poriferisodalis sp. TaxID=3101277 RepID=UPI003B01A23B